MNVTIFFEVKFSPSFLSPLFTPPTFAFPSSLKKTYGAFESLFLVLGGSDKGMACLNLGLKLLKCLFSVCLVVTNTFRLWHYIIFLF